MPLAGKSPGPAPDPIDVLVGNRVKARRLRLGWSQERLARHLGVSFQQLQKYESGANRISASVLQHAATAMDVPVSEFFEPPPELSRPSLSQQVIDLAIAIDRMPADVRATLIHLVEQVSARSS